MKILSRIISLLLIISILTVSAPAAPQTLVTSAGKMAQEARFAFLSSRLAIDFPNFFAASVNVSLDSPSEISRIQIYPGPDPLTIQTGQEIFFTAVAYDIDNEPLSGIDFDWTKTDIGRGLLPTELGDPVFKSSSTGIFSIKARAGGKEAQRRVIVTQLVSPQPPDLPIRIISSVTGMAPETGGNPPTNPDPATPDSWNNSNWITADDPDNRIGNPPGAPADDGAGSGNFQLSAPVLALPGRGIDLALNLNYNSRVWNKSGNDINFDIDYDSPAPGWTLGFGRILFMGSNAGCMLLDADGTRHGYSGSIQYLNNGMLFRGNTADGSFIDYECTFYYGGNGSGRAKLANGTTINYATSYPGTRQVLPTRITDAQGNYITITYRNNQWGQIENVTDTLGRIITFQYDSLNRLISVSGPRLTVEDTATYGRSKIRTLIRLHYRQLPLNYSFAAGITPIVRNGTPWVIDSIYYPATNTGYWFGGADASHPDFAGYYSSYGMLAKVEEHRGMGWSTAGGEEQGTITPGQMTKRATYNYPLTTANETGRTNGLFLSNAPTYEKLVESWDGADVAEPVVTTYHIDNNGFRHDGTSNSPARITTITQPSGVISKQYSYRTPGSWTDGLVFADETIADNRVIGSSLVSWSQGEYDSPRPGWAEVRDENGSKLRTEYGYTGGRFNQITRSCDYDNDNNRLRCAVAQYENSSAYIGGWVTIGTVNIHYGHHLFNLVKATGIENPDGTIASWTEYEYDNYQSQPLANTPGVIQHDYRYDPYTTMTRDGDCIDWRCYELPSQCGPQGPNNPNWYCVQYEQVSAYEPSTEKRGNITKVISYADAPMRAGAVIETRGYDKTGNLIKSSSACCEQTSIAYDDPNTTEIDTQYAYPVSQTRGSADASSPHRITTYSTYDFKTGLIRTTTDANGRTSTTNYHPDTLRPIKSISSTGAYTTFTYNDTAMTVGEETRESNDSLAGKTVKHLNGLGQVRKEESFGPGGVDIVQTIYTKFAEEWYQSRPYRSGDTIQWSEKFYDSQRRLMKDYRA